MVHVGITMVKFVTNFNLSSKSLSPIPQHHLTSNSLNSTVLLLRCTEAGRYAKRSTFNHYGPKMYLALELPIHWHCQYVSKTFLTLSKHQNIPLFRLFHLNFCANFVYKKTNFLSTISYPPFPIL